MSEMKEPVRLGFVGIVIEERDSSALVNRVVGQFQSIVTGRIGVPDHETGRAVIGLLVKGSATEVGKLTGKLGNIPGVSVKSVLTR